jgi:hypothetical protein
MSVNIIYNAINVNSLNTNSTVSIGQNAQTNWDSHNKNNYGNGSHSGIVNVLAPSNIIFDNDILDTPINDPDFVPTAQAE